MLGCGGFERAEGCPKSAAKIWRVRFAEWRTASAARVVISGEISADAGEGFADIVAAMINSGVGVCCSQDGRVAS